MERDHIGNVVGVKALLVRVQSLPLVTNFGKIEMENKTLPCGHPKECYYFHPALLGGMKHRCCACDDPNGNTRAVQELIRKGVLKEEDLVR